MPHSSTWWDGRQIPLNQWSCKTWSLINVTEKSFASCYIRMLCVALFVRQHMINRTKENGKTREYWLRLSAHCSQHHEEEASNQVLLGLWHWVRNCGEYNITHIDKLKQDNSLESVQQLKVTMMFKEVWNNESDFIALACMRAKSNSQTNWLTN